MNRRIIGRVLEKKHEQLFGSIKDPEVARLVEANAIITGGSIASLLLNEKVKDYDFYFRDKKTVEAVAKYYVAEFNRLHSDQQIKPTVFIDCDRVKIVVKSAGVASEADAKGYQYFEQRPDEEGEAYLDEVFKEAVSEGDEHPSGALEEADGAKEKYRPVFLSANAITLSDKIQLVIRFYGEPDEIHKNYDFIHCCNYWTPKGGVVLHPMALESLLVRQLQYQGSLYPVCSVIRTRKFLKQGWHINAGQYLKMLFQVSELDLTNLEILEEQLTGVDAAYFFQVIEYCKKRQMDDKDFKVTAPYLVSIIDRIFG